MLFRVNSILVTEAWNSEENISLHCISNKKQGWKQAYKYLMGTAWTYGMWKDENTF